ncbi:CRISPR-associated helicase/endonuclease Cas3 [Endozoicomonas montiporae]|uniref:CRISPR-associated endonuclease/helicase Cas3 n=1 Tax=Endozoicomonas montiporae CL-33 TaxID=570277 RepID=A0A142BG54_9GAMM|nr:CRISPR-associated helicase/endonuclease Cas3 [Endozoicomonas montiporae]AMO57730.1 CRISPR-associated endonuclease/helicase Cas3 [Endozoicomonas montiporae CL-33]
MSYKYWGKAKYEPDHHSSEYHLLPYHCLDVAAVADLWLSESGSLLSQISRHLNTPPEQAKSVVLFFILLHDLGKFDARFQNFREDIRVSLQGSEWEVDADPVYYSHGPSGYKQFCRLYDTNEAMKAVAGHHGYCDTLFDYHPPEADDELLELDDKARKEWIQFCLNFCRLSSVPDVGDIPLLAGLCSVSDWIGSSITNFTTDSDIDLCDYYQQTLPRAKKALTDAGIINPLLGAGFNFLFPDYQPRGIQTLLGQLPLEAGLTLVESDTGSGKTEWALAYASKLIESNLADGIVFGLPTQATANGLFDRIGEAADKLFPDAKPTLAHGKSRYLFSDESGFLHQSNKRAFLGSVSVATIDQILMGVLSIRHQFVRSFGTRKSVLILDEVHSYDAYMTGLIEQVLKGQHEAFSSVILLSATLHDPLKEALLSCYQGQSHTKHYPLISHTSLQGTTRHFSLDHSSEPTKVITTQCWQSDDLLPTADQLKTVREWVNQGAMVGIICNTVKAAQRLYHRLNDGSLNVPIDLFHARYTFSDRQHREEQVLASYGKKAPRQGRLLIATQVVEQSLDLDFDVLISQIAPVEFLMQRMGRLWRHNRCNTELHPRSEVVKTPLFITLLPEPPTTALTKQEWKQHYQDSGYVYKNIRLLFRTEVYLKQRQQMSFPACYREAIDYVHQVDACDDEPDALTIIAEEHNIRAQGANYTARLLSNLQSRPLSDIDPRCALLTRDGEMSESVVLFNAKGELLHGGHFGEQQDRENSTVALTKKHVKGTKDEKNYCTRAVVGKDIIYNEMGVIESDLVNELNTGS